MERKTYFSQFRFPDGPPDWNDEKSVAEWIGRVRSVAFLTGSRHDQIDQAEAREIVRHIKDATS